MQGKSNSMASRQEKVGCAAVITQDFRTRAGDFFRRGDVVRVVGVSAGQSPFRVEAPAAGAGPGGPVRSARVGENVFAWADTPAAEQAVREAEAAAREGRLSLPRLNGQEERALRVLADGLSLPARTRAERHTSSVLLGRLKRLGLAGDPAGVTAEGTRWLAERAPKGGAVPAPTHGLEPISYEDLFARLKAQGVEPVDYAFRCIVCGAVQSMRSLTRAGATDDEAEIFIGYSCVGRLSGAGAWKPGSSTPGCDWTIGGLLGSLGRGILVSRDGKTHARFYLASPEEAAELARRGGDPFLPNRSAT